MTERQQICTVTGIGALVGAVVSYLFFTEQGDALRRRIQPALDDFERELNHFRGTVARAAGIAGEGWRTLNSAVDDAGPVPGRPANPHQTVPF